MTAPVRHKPQPTRKQDGWNRWSAACPCGWTAQAHSREDALDRCREHDQLTRVAVLASEALYCECYEPVSMEFAPEKYWCARCRILDALGVAS